MVSVFFCITPLHVLNAIEFRERMSITAEESVLVVLPRLKGADVAVHKASEVVGWQKIIRFDCLYEEFARKADDVTVSLPGRSVCLVLEGKFGSVRNCEYLCVPNINSQEIIKLAAWFRPKTLALIDDGTLSATVLSRSLGACSFNPAEGASRGKALLEYCRWRRSGFRLGFLGKKQIVFTVYPEACSGDDRVSVVKNDYGWLKSNVDLNKESAPNVDFLGAPLVERDGVDEGRYLKWVRKIARFYGRSRFTYFLHPAESDEFGKRLSIAVGCKVARLELPYEMYFSLAEKTPSIVCSWFSSALENLLVLSPSNVSFECFIVPALGDFDGAVFRSARGFYARCQGSEILVHKVSSL